MTSLCVTGLIVVVVGVNENDYEEEKNNKNEIKINYDNSDYESNIYEEIIKIMLKHDAQYNKFTKKNDFKNDLKNNLKNDKKYKLLASSPIPIPKQIVNLNL